jgi:predicted nucleic acid-binding protein
MAGSVDLADQSVILPSIVIVDTNIVFERLATSFGHAQHPTNGARARDFFRWLHRDGSTGIVTPAVYGELVHLLVKLSYQTALKHDKPLLIQRFGPLSSWTELYKRDPSILRGMRSELEQLTQLLVANDLHFIQPEDFLPIHSGRTLDHELVAVMCRYGLDSTDALMLMEAQRTPALDIATLDMDLFRAQADFTIYTWL